jgi:hypothetical protein
MLYDFLKDRIHEMVNQFVRKELRDPFEDSELNPQQYYGYYRQVGELLEKELGQAMLAEQFEELWKDILVRVFSALPRRKIQIEFSKALKEQY